MSLFWFCSIWINTQVYDRAEGRSNIKLKWISESLSFSLIYLGINSYLMGKLALISFKNTFYFGSTVIHDDGNAN